MMCKTAAIHSYDSISFTYVNLKCCEQQYTSEATFYRHNWCTYLALPISHLVNSDIGGGEEGRKAKEVVGG